MNVENYEWKTYLTLNPDLQRANLITKKQVDTHYYLTGINEIHRPITCQVLIYSGRKTGSISLYTSFKKYTRNVLHVHSRLHGLHSHNNGIDFVSIFNTNKRNNNILIISVYRDTIERSISSLFQDIGKFVYGRKNNEKFAEDKNNEKIISDEEIVFLKNNLHVLYNKFFELIDSLFENYHPHDEEILNTFKMDIFSKPFDKDNGYQIYNNNDTKLIMLRFDKIQLWENIIRSNTEYTDFTLLKSNITNDKKTAELYNIFKSNLKIPKIYLDKIFEYEEKNLKYFYHADEIAIIKSKWYNISY